MQIKNKTLQKPIIQGGMGVGVSLGNLAGNVAKCGGMGVISCANPGYLKEDFWANPDECNIQGLREEIAKAREISNGNGLIAVNAMVAGVQFETLVKTAVESKIDCIISGAGLPLGLPELVKGSEVLIAPIVSSAKAAKTLNKLWDKKYNRVADFIVIEGPTAGGHLGFAGKDLVAKTTQDLEQILKEVKEAIAPFEEKYNTKIPVFVAGSVNTREKVKKILSLGADGVQVATRFIATKECDATDEFKNIYVNSKNSQIDLIRSPVGMDGRAIITPMIKKLEQEGRIAPKKCVKCVHTCNPSQTPYCITKALIEGVLGNYEEGLFFCDDDVDVITEISTVSKVISELMED